MQTLAGLWLDSEKEEEIKSITAPSGKDGPRLQWLLNGFLFINVLHLAAIWGLGYLKERKQNTQREAVAQHERESEDEEGWGASGSALGIDGPSLSPERGPGDRTPADDQITSPLLPHRDVSSVYQPDTILAGATTPEEVTRGKLFASLCAGTVGFAWALFLTTSFLKIRSKHEREGHS